MGKPKKGRVVWNHSTHIDGLIPVLERLTDCDEITTVTPGVISRSKSHSPHMQLKVSVPIRGGFKAIARQGKSVQEVFVVTTLSLADLEDAIGNALKYISPLDHKLSYCQEKTRSREECAGTHPRARPA